MISAPDRTRAVALIDAARSDGARLGPACEVVGITPRTYERWTREGGVREDGRPGAARSAPANSLSADERERVLAVCHHPEYADQPPGQIVPALADEGEYIASESTFYRILRAEGEQQHRGRAKPPQRSRPRSTHCATEPNQVWCWDVTWLPGPVLGQFLYLYLILDLFSRKIVGWEVHTEETAEHARDLVERAVWREGCVDHPLVLHGDNGSPLKAATVQATLARLGVTPSYSRPRVSDDNAFAEALFRTCKYVPDFPKRGFASLEEARAWVAAFVRWYNRRHRHRGINYVTPDQRHRGEDQAILARRRTVYESARRKRPGRWSRGIRNWAPAKEVWLNPETSERALVVEAA